MARDSKHLSRRNAKIKKRFIELHKKGLRSAIIFEHLIDEFYLSPSMLYRILAGIKEFEEVTEN